MIKKSKIIIVLLSFYLINNGKAYCQISLAYQEFDIFFEPKKCNDTLQFTLTRYYPGHKLKLFLKDCGGEAYIELFNKKNKLVMTGHYVNGPDTLLKYSFAKQVGYPFDKKYYGVWTIKYLNPLQKGTWTYFDGNGKITEKYEYEYTFH